MASSIGIKIYLITFISQPLLQMVVHTCGGGGGGGWDADSQSKNEDVFFK